MINKKFLDLFNEPVRNFENNRLTQFHMDIAASIQDVIEIVVLKMTKKISEDYKLPNLCLAGGVALNCVANSKILKAGYFKNLWIQPAAGDAGGALGSALLVWYNELNNSRKISKFDSMKGAFLGPEYDQNEIENILLKCGAKFKVLDKDSILKLTAKVLAEGKAIGWFQGRMEFGPRALGARSIIADPRSDKMQQTLNLKVKNRESFRPFAPSVLRENLNEWFDLDCDSPYMLLVSDVKKNIRYKLNESDKNLFGIDKLNISRSKIPAVTHVDYTSRVQTVDKDTNPRFHALILEFKKITGCPILVNTSFNVRGEPIVCTPTDAFNCFMGTELDALVIGNCFLDKKEQNIKFNKKFKEKYSLD